MADPEDRMALVQRGTPPLSLCCEPIMRAMPDGSWLCLWLSGGSVEPATDNVVAGRRSVDGGVTWQADGDDRRIQECRTQVFWDRTPRAILITEMMVWPDGRVSAMLVEHDGAFSDWHTLISHSADSGHTWPTASPSAAG